MYYVDGKLVLGACHSVANALIGYIILLKSVFCWINLSISMCLSVCCCLNYGLWRVSVIINYGRVALSSVRDSANYNISVLCVQIFAITHPS